MAKDMANEIVKYEQVKDKIIVLRGEPVLLDADVAQLYGVETRVVNQAVKNNPDKFPEGFLIPLTLSEKKRLSKILITLRVLNLVRLIPLLLQKAVCICW